MSDDWHPLHPYPRACAQHTNTDLLTLDFEKSARQDFEDMRLTAAIAIARVAVLEGEQASLERRETGRTFPFGAKVIPLRPRGDAA